MQEARDGARCFGARPSHKKHIMSCGCAGGTAAVTADMAVAMSVKKRLSGLVRAAGKMPSTVKQTHGKAPTHCVDLATAMACSTAAARGVAH